MQRLWSMSGVATSIPFDREVDCLAGSEPALPLRSVRPDGLPSLLETMERGQAAFVQATGFLGTSGQVLLLPGPGGLAGALAGLGTDRSLFAHGGLPMALPEGTAWTLQPGDFDMDAAIEGFCLGAYQYAALSRPKRGPALLAGVAAGHSSVAAARAAWLARDLVNTPANLLGPMELAEATRALGARFGATCRIIGGEALEAEYPAIAAVGRGADRKPLVASFAWSGGGAGPDAKLVSLCGKGVCFDSGGYDLKPPAGMLRMKKDMGGAALMLGLAHRIMQADLTLRLEVRIGCVENMVSGAAMRPMDVLHTRRGLTVEIGNTDAEGRLVLCDLLTEAAEASPDLLLDAATLTGAARVALGPDLPGLFTPDDGLAGRLIAAGERAHDPLWRLPLHAGYDHWLDSTVADVNNVSSKPHAGAIVAALFLQRFVPAGTAWAHLDTYSWNDQTRPGRPEGGEGLGLRALYAVVSDLQVL